MRIGPALVILVLLAACGGGNSGPHSVLTFRATINGVTSDIPQQGGLNLPNIGEVAAVTAYEGNRQVQFSLLPQQACSNIVTISPQNTSAQQTVTSIATGQCDATVQASDGNVATLTIFSLPPP